MSEFKIGIGDKVLFKVDRSRHGLLPDVRSGQVCQLRIENQQGYLQVVLCNPRTLGEGEDFACRTTDVIRVYPKGYTIGGVKA